MISSTLFLEHILVVRPVKKSQNGNAFQVSSFSNPSIFHDAQLIGSTLNMFTLDLMLYRSLLAILEIFTQ